MASQSNPLRAPPHVQALLQRLHDASIAEESSPSIVSAVTGLKELRVRDPEAGNKASHNLMIDKFVALDKDKCELVYQSALATKARTIVEIGTSFGVSTIYSALAVALNDPENGKVVGTEIESSKAARAEAHWKEAGDQVRRHIELRLGDSRETLKEGLDNVDSVLIDIWAAMALPALKVLQPKLKPGAIISIDNTISLADMYKDLLTYSRDANSPFTTLTLPYSNGFEMAVYRPF